MKTETLILQDWDDLVFENRNKSYGAYIIRKSYSGNTMKAFGMGVMVVGGLLILPSIASSIFGEKIIPEKIADRGLILHVKEILIEQIVKPKQDRPVVQTHTRDIAPLVTTREIVTETDVLPQELQNDSGTGGNTGDGTATTEGGTVGEVTGTAIEMHPIIDYAEIAPQYPGGMEALAKFMQSHMKYPGKAKRDETEGKVFVQFVVSYDGTVKDIHVVRGISAECDKEAARVIALMPSWIPGIHNKQPVSVRMVLPIAFLLNR